MWYGDAHCVGAVSQEPSSLLRPGTVDRSPEAFQRWAEDYYEVPVDLEAVRHVFASRPLTEEVVRALNSEIFLADLVEDIAEIGYPMS